MKSAADHRKGFYEILTVFAGNYLTFIEPVKLRKCCPQLCKLLILLFLYISQTAFCSNAQNNFPNLRDQYIPDKVKLFSVFEINMKSMHPGEDPYINGPEIKAVFTGPDHSKIHVNGFWNGDSIFTIRFAPDKPGRWTYCISSPDTGMNGINGSFMAVKNSKKDFKKNILTHGFLKPSGYCWKLSDGTSFMPIGETQWSFTEEFHTSEWKDWIRALQNRGFNSFLGCIWLGKYQRAGISPFIGNPGDDNLNERYFDRLDEWIRWANNHGIIMGLTIGGFPDNSKWFTMFNTKVKNDRWFRYCVRRYAAFNVRWVLYGEVDEVNPPWATWENNAEEMARIVKEEDPYDHPVGSHHRYIDRATARSSYIDYLCIQSNRNAFGRMNAEYQYQTTQDYRQYGKPLWFEEYWYENMERLFPGIHNTYRNFIAGLAFPTMGSLMRAHEMEKKFVPSNTVKSDNSLYNYLMESDTGLQYMQYFKQFFKSLEFCDFSPASDKIKNPGLTQQCGRFGNNYVIFKMKGGEVNIDLTGISGKLKVQKMNIKTGSRSVLPEITGGGWRTLDPGDTTDAIYIVKGKYLPQKPVITSPLKNAEFVPEEMIYLNTQGEISSIKIELYRGQKSIPLIIEPNKSQFRIPNNTKEGDKLKISLMNTWGETVQFHNIVSVKKNSPPVLTRTIASVQPGKPVGIQLGFSDPDGPGPYQFSIIKGPENGKLSGSGNDRIYISNPGFEGTDQFIWLVNDGINDAEKPATVTINVQKSEY